MVCAWKELWMTARENANSVPQKQMKVPFQWLWEVFTTAGRNISMGLYIFRTVGCVFKGHVYVRLCNFWVFGLWIWIRVLSRCRGGLWASLVFSFTAPHPKLSGKHQSKHGQKAPELWQVLRWTCGKTASKSESTQTAANCGDLIDSRLKPQLRWGPAKLLCGSQNQNSSHCAPHSYSAKMPCRPTF